MSSIQFAVNVGYLFFFSDFRKWAAKHGDSFCSNDINKHKRKSGQTLISFFVLHTIIKKNKVLIRFAAGFKMK